MIAPLWILEPDTALRPILTMALTGVGRVEIVEALPDEPPPIEALLLSLRLGESWPLWAETLPVVAMIAKGDRRDWPSRWATLEKPFRPALLRATVVRMIETLPSREILPMAGGGLHLPLRRLIGPAGETQLTEKETALLHCLLTAHVPVSRAELLSGVWGYRSDTPTRTVETHVYRLRRKIERLGLPLAIDATGDGYRTRTL